MRTICVISGSRAEYGLLRRLMKMIDSNKETNLQLIVTNMHLRSEYGNTYKEIENDGFKINKKVYMNPLSDTPFGVAQSMGEELLGINSALEELRPDLLVVFGDRYEMLVAASVAMIHKIPIAHIGGGAVTAGSYDDNIRHAITKLSHLHFTSTENHRSRVIQLGENPHRVFTVGSLGVENIKKTTLLTKDVLEQKLNVKIDKNTILVTYHPETLSQSNTNVDINSFFEALNEKPEVKVIFTLPNSDTGNSLIISKINQFVKQHPYRSKAFPSLGNLVYLSLMQFVAAVVGNSSSGLIEAPSFGIPTLNIGKRQDGRELSSSVINCSTDKQSIIGGLESIFRKEIQSNAKKTKNPYEKENSAQSIFKIIKEYPLESLNQKIFFKV